MSSSRVMLEHNYSTSFDDNTSLMGCSTSDFNIPVHKKVNKKLMVKIFINTYLMYHLIYRIN